ncbi:MAG: CBS domain-containing protein, partial [Rhodobacterales bacterium]|nr:CBS domain-containing protein [Rhodobacterales bacterium]
PLGLARAIDLLDPPAGASLADVTPPLGDALAPTDSLLDALRLMRLRGADLLPVVADGGAVVGLVTARTLLDGLAPVVDGLLDNATAALFGPPPS